MIPTWRVLVGDVRDKLAELPDASVQCVVTSPPYWGLRDYGMGGQIGLEPTPDAFVAALVGVFAEVRRVLADDGVCWLNLGDSYVNSGHQTPVRNKTTAALKYTAQPWKSMVGMKSKDLCGIPWRVAFALQADGWYLRSDIIWAKPNPMPESVTDRPTKAHEYIFLLSKRQTYYYDAEAIAEPASVAMLQQMEQGYDGLGLKDYEGAGVQNPSSVKARIIANARARVTARGHGKESDRQPNGRQPQRNNSGGYPVEGITRNARTVWDIATQPYPDAHFATFPEAIPERCIKAGSRLGDMVLDPFCGSGTTGRVAIRLGRSFVGIELNPAYAQLARKRIDNAAPLFAEAVS